MLAPRLHRSADSGQRAPRSPLTMDTSLSPANISQLGRDVEREALAVKQVEA